MNAIVTRLTATVGANQHLDLHLSNLPIGRVEIIVVRKETPALAPNLRDLLPNHALGKMNSSLRREELYTDAR